MKTEYYKAYAVGTNTAGIIKVRIVLSVSDRQESMPLDPMSLFAIIPTQKCHIHCTSQPTYEGHS